MSEHQVAIVTGGGGALGAAIARRLREDGYAVVLADIDEPAARESAAKLINENNAAPVLAARLDVAEPDSVTELVDGVGAAFGRIDTVVNNAAVQRRGGVADFAVADWDLAHQVNLRGPLLLCQAVHPYWVRQRGGSVVNITSRVWLSGGAPIYVAAKAGLVGLTRSLATELAPLGVTANAVAPSFVSTAFTRQGRNTEQFAELADRYRRITPLDRLAEPDDIAYAVAFLASPRARYITGEVLHVCGGAQLAPLP